MGVTRRGTNNVAFLLGLSLALSLFGCGSLITIVLGWGEGVSSRLDLFGHTLFDRFLFALFLLLLFSGLCDLDDDVAAIELFLVQELGGLLSGLESVEGDEAVARRTVATVNDLGGKAVDEVSGKWQRRGVASLRQKVGMVTTHISAATGAKKALRPSSVVLYARLPANTWGL